MPDYYYNSDHQTLDSAVSKNVWLLKTIDELHIFINVVGSMDDRLAMSQIS